MNLRIRVKTIAQFKILEFIKRNFSHKLFENGKLSLNIIDNNCIEVLDCKDSIKFFYDCEKDEIFYE